MSRWALFLTCGAAAGALAMSGTAFGASKHGLDLYTATVDATTAAQLESGGYDVAAVRPVFAGTEVDLVLSPGERTRLAREGVELRPKKDKNGRTQTQRAALQEAGGFTVYRSWDEPGGIRDELYALARRNPQLLKLEVIGRSHEGREYIALKMTQGARDVPDGVRPAVLYVSLYHAREWISVEVNRRLLRWYIDQWRANNKPIKRLLKDTELWFVLAHNPDGYQYTFDAERLWRKNLRDNDANGVIDNRDGVDPNRNHPEHWNYDEEGSSSQFSSQTYRGPFAVSEPETQAIQGLHARIPFRFAISYHSFGQLLLYTQGWQVQTPSADDPIYVALTGTDDNPAVPEFNPGVGADLYTTNGEYTDWAHGLSGTLAWTPELSEGCEDCGFVFPDDEALVQAEFERNLNFAVNVARSAGDPDDPVSHAGIDTKGFYLDVSQIDPWKTHNPASDLAVDLSYGGGASQPVEVLAKRSLGPVTLRYRINGGSERTVPTSEASDGERFGGNNAYDIYYHYLRGEIPGIAVDDSVEYWFTGGGDTSPHATFQVVEDANADVLILAAEDRTGASTSPAYASTSPSTPNYLSYYTAALTANGLSYDVYDIDAMGRQAPDHLGVLSHYRAVVWYTGNDFVLREPGWSPGNASRLANDLMLEARAYLNEGGRLLYTGQRAGLLENGFAGTQRFDPVANARCVTPGQPTLARCQVISDKNDFLQYYLGAYFYNDNAGTSGPGSLYDVMGVAAPFESFSWSFNGTESAQNHNHSASFITTSGILPPAMYPQFASSAAAKYDRPGGPFAPHTGEHYMYSQIGDISYKRLTRTITVPAGGASLSFWTSFDTEPHWDFVFVEAHTVGQEDWTTLPDQNGHTDQDTGESCPAGWHELHPFLAHYQTLNADETCSATGTTGAWNAAEGNSSGWQQWQVDLSAYAGKQVEVSIAYVSDWAVQGLGTFVDDIDVSTGEGTTSFEQDSDVMDGWQVTGPPAGSSPNSNNFVRTTADGFPEGAAVTTQDTIYFGFGFEGINGAATRAEVMRRSIDYLIP